MLTKALAMGATLGAGALLGFSIEPGTAQPAVDLATELGPTGAVLAVVWWVVKRVPRMFEAVTTTLERLTVILNRLARVLLLFEKKLESDVGGESESGDRVKLYGLIADGASEEMLLEELMEHDPEDSLPVHLTQDAEAVQRVVQLYKRKRENSGPRKAAR